MVLEYSQIFQTFCRQTQGRWLQKGEEEGRKEASLLRIMALLALSPQVNIAIQNNIK